MNYESFYKISYGLYVVSSKKGDKINGFISNTVFQISAEPPKFAITCNKNNYTADYIRDSKLFSVSVLEKEVESDIIGQFGYKTGKDTDKFKGFRYNLTKNGLPVLLDGTIAWFECHVTEIYDTGTHWLFIGSVLEAEILDGTKEPLTYAYYRETRKGKAPKNAPTYIDPLKLEEVKKTQQPVWACPACGYEYDATKGDETAQIPPNIKFEDLPDDWVCPICGMAKSEFYEKT